MARGEEKKSTFMETVMSIESVSPVRYVIYLTGMTVTGV